MFGKKKIVIAPSADTSDLLIQISESVELTKKVRVTVPNQYEARLYIDNKLLARLAPCVEKDVLETYGKEYAGKQLKVAYYVATSITQAVWGFGNIQVNNERLKEAYRVGTNGKFAIKIVDHTKLIKAFPNSNIITIEEVKEKLISTIKTIGVPILAEYFSNTNTSVFEMSSLVADFRDQFEKKLQKETIFAEMGIEVSNFSVNGFHANEDDLAMIRKRINQQ